MYIRELTNEEFKNFSEKSKKNLVYQTVEYALVMNNQNFESIFVGLVDAVNIYGASLILIEKLSNFKYAYAPRGFLIDYTDYNLLETFTKEIKKFLSKKGVMAVKICPTIVRYIHNPKTHLTRKDESYDKIFNNLKKLDYHHLGYNNFFEGLKPRYEAIIDVAVPYYNIFKNIDKKFRTKIRSAEEKGVKIYKGNYNDLQLLYFQTKKKYPRDLKYFQDCYKYFDKNNEIEFYYAKLDTAEYLKVITNKFHAQEGICNSINSSIVKNNKLINKKMNADQLYYKYNDELLFATKLLRENPNGIVLASVLTVKHNKDIFLLIDGYNPDFKSLNAKHLLIWKLIEQYSKDNCFQFNLGGLTNNDLENNPYQGLNRFKLGFNSSVNEYIGDLELITNSTLYFMYRNTSPIRNILKK